MPGRRIFCIALTALFWAVIPASGSEMVRTDRVVVSYDGFTEHYARQVLDSADRSLAEISDALGSAPSRPVEIILADTDARFAELTHGRLPEWSAAAALGDGRIVVTPLSGSKQFLERIITHELVHAVIDDAAGDAFVPRWFHEGCAQYFSGEWRIRDRFYLTWYTVTGRLMSFQDIQDVFSSDPRGAGLAYDQSMLAVRHLTGMNGRQVLPRILGGLQHGEDFPTAFRNAAGVWPSEFEEHYIAALRKTYGRRSLYLLIPGTWTAILLLAIVVYFVKRRRNRRLMSQWEIVEAAEKIINFDDYHRGY